MIQSLCRVFVLFCFCLLFPSKKLYLLRSIQNVNNLKKKKKNVNKRAATFFLSFAIMDWYSVNKTTIISYKLHQRQLKMKKLPSPYITNLCCAPTRTCFKFPCQFTIPILYQARLVAIENTTRTGLSKDTFDNVLTIQKKDTVQFKN